MISWGAYSAIVKKISEWQYPIIAVTRRIYFYGLVLLLPVMLIEHGTPWKAENFKNPYIVLNLLFLGLFASALGFLLWNLATDWIGAVKTSLYIYVSPIVTAILSVLILHEHMTAVSVAGSGCILAGLLISQGKWKKA